MTFPTSERVSEQVIVQVTEQVRKLLSVADFAGLSSAELMTRVGIKHRPTFLYNYLQPALDKGLMQMTIPDKPQSRLQRYALTETGKKIKTENE